MFFKLAYSFLANLEFELSTQLLIRPNFEPPEKADYGTRIVKKT